MKKVSVASLGCSKNLVDAEQMLGLLEKNGFEIMENEEDADIIIVNTCTFIESAKVESIDCILEMAGYKKAGRNKKLIVTGCLAQRYKDDVLREIPEVDAVVGTNEYHRIADIINEICLNSSNDEKAEDNSNKRKIVNCSDIAANCGNLPRIRTSPTYTAYLKIAEGCDNHCTYCVIPSIRGKYRSRKIEDIVCEAEKMADEGVKELIVIAQDTTRYGKDLYGEYSLPKLLKKLCRIDKIKWVRVHYCYPELVTDELIEVFKSEDKICNYMDIPIQHCNDDILKRMGRRTNKAQICGLIEKLRAEIPDIAIRTSIIVGFPSETDEQFNELKEFLEKVRLDKVGIFTYSQEEDTPAAEFDGQIDEEIKVRRQEILALAQSEVSEEINLEKVGRKIDVLVEGYDNIIKYYYGRSYADSIDIDGKVFFTSKVKAESGDIVNVKITDSSEYDLFGEA